MYVSVFDLFKIGIGPSSSHTIGPMKAAKEFTEGLVATTSISDVARIQVSLYGSLALTGLGHGTDKAILAGLEGFDPKTVDPDELREISNKVKTSKVIHLLRSKQISFDFNLDLLWLRNQNLPGHPNGMNFKAFNMSGSLITEQNYYSIGGGFISKETSANQTNPPTHPSKVLDFNSAEELLNLCEQKQLKIHELILENEISLLDERKNLAHKTATHSLFFGELDEIIRVMRQCIEKGLTTSGILPGGLKVKRRAFELHQKLLNVQNKQKTLSTRDPLEILDWVNVFALAVNEENASYGRVVTAPTNGAAGIIPAVLEYYLKFVEGADQNGARNFLLTATAIGTLYKKNASISGAEVGCQGEVGVASSMAAGALAGVLGGSNQQIENAAEIAMEHHLGMTCDPVGGLVQIPCIERNAMGAVKAINAARLALQGDGTHTISLDQVIKTMWETGQDMSTKYKETSRGGLAMNIPEC